MKQLIPKSLRILSAFLSAIFIFLCFSVYLIPSAEDAVPDPGYTPEESEYIARGKTLKVGYVQDRIPVSFKNGDGECDGISKYIFDRVSEISGLKFEYAALPDGQVTYDYLLGEGFDLVTSVEYNEENKKARGILISDPYLSSRKVVVAKEGLDFRYDGDFTVAVSTGSQTLKKVLSTTFPHFKLEDYDSITDCFDAVNSGDVDLMIQNQYVAEYWLTRPKYEKLTAIPVFGLEDELCFSAVVSFDDSPGTSQEEGELLIGILDKAIHSMNEDEQGSYIIQGVMENQYEYTFWDFVGRYRYSLAILTLSVIIIIVLIFLLTKLRIRIAESKAEAKAKGRFLSTMSHEIRTPLNGLIGLNYLMLKKLDDKEKLEEYLKQSSVTANYLLSLVNDILDSSKLEEQKLDLMLQPTELALVIETVRTIEQSAMSAKHIDFSVNAKISYPYLLADEVRIQQVILNLLDNAKKFTADGGRVKLDTDQQRTDEGDILTTVKVSDNGRGMSEEFQKKIFDLFSQELQTVSKGNQGTGLGLSISRRLARLMGGDLTCVSKKGEGSEFTFTFRAKASDPPERKRHTDTDEGKKSTRILVAEDNELNGEIIYELLISSGFECDLAENGRVALEKFAASPNGYYGVILMDLLMPEMDGFETARAVRALERDDAETVKIFACTANSFAEEKDKAYESGMNDFITKPINIDELLAKLS